MANFIIEQCNIKDKHWQRLLKVLFGFIGAIPYIFIFVFTSLYMSVVVPEAPLLSMNIERWQNTFIVIGACTCWYLFCKFLKIMLMVIRTKI